LRGPLSLRDFLHVQGILLLRRWHVVAVVFLLTAVAVVGAWRFNSRVNRPGLPGESRLMLVILVLVPTACLLPLLKIAVQACRKQGYFAHSESVLDSRGIHANPASGRSRTVPWEAFDHFLASERAIVLFLRGTRLYWILARDRLVDAKDWDLLRDFLGSRLPPA
jgi:hypothetical protein